MPLSHNYCARPAPLAANSRDGTGIARPSVRPLESKKQHDGVEESRPSPSPHQQSVGRHPSCSCAHRDGHAAIHHGVGSAEQGRRAWASRSRDGHDSTPTEPTSSAVPRAGQSALPQEDIASQPPRHADARQDQLMAMAPPRRAASLPQMTQERVKGLRIDCDRPRARWSRGRRVETTENPVNGITTAAAARHAATTEEHALRRPDRSRHPLPAWVRVAPHSRGRVAERWGRVTGGRSLFLRGLGFPADSHSHYFAPTPYLSSRKKGRICLVPSGVSPRTVLNHSL